MPAFTVEPTTNCTEERPWSVPAADSLSEFCRLVRPNSESVTIITSFKRPRSFKSSISAAIT